MAVSKAEVSKSLSDSQLAQVDALEDLFDRSLREEYSGKRLLVDVEAGIHDKVKQEVARRYRLAGWKVKFDSNQRDGSWVEFS
jgi:hypothetical protein